jgi:hypothetical protein
VRTYKVDCAHRGLMGFAIGNLTTIAEKRGDFGSHSLYGSWVEDLDGKRGWFITFDGLDGLESRSFSIVDGEIHQSGRQYRAGPDGRTIVDTNPKIAELGASAKQAILDAIAKWEAEAREKPVPNTCSESSVSIVP